MKKDSRKPGKKISQKRVLCYRNDRKIYQGQLKNFFIFIDTSHSTTSRTPKDTQRSRQDPTYVPRIVGHGREARPQGYPRFNEIINQSISTFHFSFKFFYFFN